MSFHWVTGIDEQLYQPHSVISSSSFLLLGLWKVISPLNIQLTLCVWMFWHLTPELFCLQDRLAGQWFENKHNDPGK